MSAHIPVYAPEPEDVEALRSRKLTEAQLRYLANGGSLAARQLVAELEQEAPRA